MSSKDSFLNVNSGWVPSFQLEFDFVIFWLNCVNVVFFNKFLRCFGHTTNLGNFFYCWILRESCTFEQKKFDHEDPRYLSKSSMSFFFFFFSNRVEWLRATTMAPNSWCSVSLPESKQNLARNPVFHPNSSMFDTFSFNPLQLLYWCSILV